jgi:maltose O-acetyltransferase
MRAVTLTWSMLGTIFRWFSDLLRELRTRNWIATHFPTTSLEMNVFLKGDLQNLKLGQNVIIQSGTVLHLGGMEWCCHAGRIEIGDDSVISPNCVLYGGGPGGIRVGRRFDCGPGVGIFASRTNYTLGPNNHIFAPVVIGNDVIVYANAVISPGVTVGDGAVIAANSVVTSDVLRNVLVGGCPARILRTSVHLSRIAQ